MMNGAALLLPVQPSLWPLNLPEDGQAFSVHLGPRDLKGFQC